MVPGVANQFATAMLTRYLPRGLLMAVLGRLLTASARKLSGR